MPTAAVPQNQAPPGPDLTRNLLALVTGQVFLHAAMAGLRLSAPLMLLREGAGGVVSPELAAGALLGLFALAPVLTAMPAGRWTDRRGYRKPVRAAVAMVVAGALIAVPGAWLEGPWRALLLSLAAVLTGIGANLGLIAVQRTAGRLAEQAGSAAPAVVTGDVDDVATVPDARPRGTELKRVFSWLGLAPSLANVVGPVLVGLAIDAAGFTVAHALMAVLPLATLWIERQVHADVAAPTAPRPGAAGAPARESLRSLVAVPGMVSLLAVNWMFSSSWDLHSFLVPLLGHERGLSASAIGTVMGVFAASVAAVRLVVPLVAQHLREWHVLATAMGIVGTVFVLYPFAHALPAMLACATVLGLALGVVQPMVMTSLHHIAPPHRQGEAIAMRSMFINASSAVLPLVFGALGAHLGAAGMFRVMAAVMLVGLVVFRLRRPASF